ncbi:MAG: GTPase-activating protein S13 [Alyxoria varia]|nr:MAG: GTPase-activating protein S13 [Alyxoria varia]
MHTTKILGSQWWLSSNLLIYGDRFMLIGDPFQTQTITDPGHDDMIHDAVLDYYGRRLATCSSDRTIKIFEVENDTHRLTDTLKGHESPIWSLSWAHPKHGTILASSSYDGKVLIWRESPNPSSSTVAPSSTYSGAGAHPQQSQQPSQTSARFTRIIDFALHTASVNIVSWAPHELGAHLGCASSDGCVSVLSFNDSAAAGGGPQQQGAQGQGQGAWETAVFQAHDIGANSVSWAPALLPGSLEKAATSGAAGGMVKRFVTGGSDCKVKIWEWKGTPGAGGQQGQQQQQQTQQGQWQPLCTLDGHTDWVRDVAWSPSLLSQSYIASASQDHTVRIWVLGGNGAANAAGGGSDAADPSNWRCTTLTFDTVVWRVSWSLSGNVLAVCGGDNKVSLWKERVRDGGWECVKEMEE